MYTICNVTVTCNRGKPNTKILFGFWLRRFPSKHILHLKRKINEKETTNSTKKEFVI